MIVDKISNWQIYFKTPVFKEVFDQLATYSVDTPNGVYKNHDKFYFKVMSYDTKLDSTIIESHIKEVDVQILLTGHENIKLYDKSVVEVKEAYDQDNDVTFYNAKGTPHSEVNLEPGYMGVFFPDDIHHPQFAVNNKIEKLKKIVIKIDEDLFS